MSGRQSNCHPNTATCRLNVADRGPNSIARETPGNASADVLAVHCRSAAELGKVLPVLEHLAPVLADALASLRSRQQKIKRLNRMEAILEIASQWNQTHELEPL